MCRANLMLTVAAASLGVEEVARRLAAVLKAGV